jgi:hypothetical protein
VKTLALTVIFAIGLALGKVFANDLVLMFLSVLIFALLVAGLMYESDDSREHRYAREYRRNRDRRMHSVHLGHDYGDDARPE